MVRTAWSMRARKKPISLPVRSAAVPVPVLQKDFSQHAVQADNFVRSPITMHPGSHLFVQLRSRAHIIGSEVEFSVLVVKENLLTCKKREKDIIQSSWQKKKHKKEASITFDNVEFWKIDKKFKLDIFFCPYRDAIKILIYAIWKILRKTKNYKLTMQILLSSLHLVIKELWFPARLSQRSSSSIVLHW